MNKFNFIYFAKHLVAFMVLFSGVSMAETINTIPEACNTFPLLIRVPTTVGTAQVSNYGKFTFVNPSQDINNCKCMKGTPFSGFTGLLHSNIKTLGVNNLSHTQKEETFKGNGTFTVCQLVKIDLSGLLAAKGSTIWSTNASSATSSCCTFSNGCPQPYLCDGYTPLVLNVKNHITGKNSVAKNMRSRQAAITIDNAAVFADLFQCRERVLTFIPQRNMGKNLS